MYICIYIYIYHITSISISRSISISISIYIHKCNRTYIYIYVYVLEIGKLYNEHFGMIPLTFSIRQQRRRGVVVAIYPNKLSK